jgi:serine/threonine protein kinase
VQLIGWFESDDYVHIAMEYISHGHLRNYLEMGRSESESEREAKVITGQVLEGLAIIHQYGFAHRDLKPEVIHPLLPIANTQLTWVQNIFIVSISPIWVKIGDFGLAKLAKDGTVFRTQAFSRNYVAPEAGVTTSGDTSEYTKAVDIWALGCITHEILTQTLPFRGLFELSSYCNLPEFPREAMHSRNISQKGIEFVESMLALPPERRIAAKEALNSEWLRLEDAGTVGLEIEGSTGRASPEGPTTRTAVGSLSIASSSAISSASGHSSVASPKISTMSTSVGKDSLINKKADAAQGLYQTCVALRERLALVPDFEQFLEPLPDTVEDPVTQLWRCFRMGSSLCVLFNATRPVCPIQDERLKPNLGSANDCKAATYHFLQGIKNVLHISDEDSFMIHNLYSDDTNGFVKVCLLFFF